MSEAGTSPKQRFVRRSSLPNAFWHIALVRTTRLTERQTLCGLEAKKNSYGRHQWYEGADSAPANRLCNKCVELT